MKTWGLLLSLLLLGAGCAGTSCQLDPARPSREERVNDLIRRTVQVYALCEEGQGSGSGVILGQQGPFTYIATARHVAEEGCELTVDGKVAEVRSFDDVENFDIAIIRVLQRTYEPALLKADIYLGMPVTVVGFPSQPYTGKTSLQVTSGDLSAFLKRRYKLSAPAYFGSSGGPAFDEKGALVGLVVQLMARNGAPLPGEYFATPAWRVFELYHAALHQEF